MCNFFLKDVGAGEIYYEGILSQRFPTGSVQEDRIWYWKTNISRLDRC